MEKINNNENKTSSEIIVVIDPLFSSDKAIEENVCTFKYTKNRYSLQKWYLCNACNIYCCEICKIKCHNDHICGEENESEFFCDCGSDNINCLCVA